MTRRSRAFKEIKKYLIVTLLIVALSFSIAVGVFIGTMPTNFKLVSTSITRTLILEDVANNNGKWTPFATESWNEVLLQEANLISNNVYARFISSLHILLKFLIVVIEISIIIVCVISVRIFSKLSLPLYRKYKRMRNEF